MATSTKVLNVQLSNADATILAASTTVIRYLRSVHMVNITGGAVTVNFGVGANLTAGANADIYGESVGAAARMNPLYYGGKGKAVINTAIRAFASAITSINLTLVYDEVDLT